jgi:hypothetical protein
MVLVLMPFVCEAQAQDQTVHQVRLRCEGEFRNVTNYQRPADAPLNNPVRAMSSDLCQSGDLEITVARTEYLPDTPMDLKDLVKGAAAAMGRRPGVEKPMQSTAVTKVSELPALRLAFSAMVEGKLVSVQSVYFLKGQTLWTVQIAFSSDETKRMEAEKILSSVRLQSGQ